MRTKPTTAKQKTPVPEEKYEEQKSLESLCELEKRTKLLINLPEVEGLVVLNIASWGGGCRPWELAENKDDFSLLSFRHAVKRQRAKLLFKYHKIANTRPI